jgi:hypothetical protein
MPGDPGEPAVATPAELAAPPFPPIPPAILTCSLRAYVIIGVIGTPW